MLLGDLITWFYQSLAGIKVGDAGFKTIVMKPAIGGLDSVNASYTTPYGLVKSRWEKAGKQFDWYVTIPANSKALVCLPTASIAKIKEDGASLKLKSAVHNGRVEVEIGSGNYHFEVEDYEK